jgi:hypothetical protein
MIWHNFKQTIREYMGMSFNYKEPQKLYYHTEWTLHNLDEISKKIDKVRIKLEQRKKEFEARPPR